MYEELDESIDPALLDRAIDTFVAEQHRFHQPNGGLELTLAGCYTMATMALEVEEYGWNQDSLSFRLRSP